MRFLNPAKILIIALLIPVVLFGMTLKVAAADTLLSITLTKPAQSQVIISSGLAITGNAPPGVIITITIQDEEYQKLFQVHETNLITDGTTTSDKNGNWVYIPSKNLVPGKYSAIASFQNGNSGSISSEKIFFSVADESGATSWFSIPGITLVLVILIFVIALIYIIFRVFDSKKKRTMLLHTTWGDIPVKEVIDENNIVEIVPLTEPMINLGQSPFQQVQPVMQTVYAQPQVYMQPQGYPQAQQQIQPPVQNYVQQNPNIQTVQTRPVNTQNIIVPVQNNINQQLPANIQQNVQPAVPNNVVPQQQTQPVQVTTKIANPFQGRPLIKTTSAQLLN